jgi:hypothetical protein
MFCRNVDLLRLRNVFEKFLDNYTVIISNITTNQTFQGGGYVGVNSKWYELETILTSSFLFDGVTKVR